MSIVLKNNASDFLAAAIDSSQTTLTLQSAASFPAIIGAQYFYVTLQDTAGQLEIVKVTARSGNSFTVVRGQDGTSAASFTAGSRVELRVNAGSVDDFVEQNAELGIYTPAGTGASSRIIQTKLRESVSVKDFGAVGDGVTDDTAAIQAALNYGGHIIFPTANYLCDNVFITKTVYIDFQASFIKRATNLSGDMFEVLLNTPATNVTFVNGTIDGNNQAANRGMVIHCNNTNTILVLENMILQNNCLFDAPDVPTKSQDTDLLYVQNAREVWVDGCQFKLASRQGISFVSPTQKIKIVNSFFEDCYLYGIDIEPNTASQFMYEDVVICGNTFKNCGSKTLTNSVWPNNGTGPIAVGGGSLSTLIARHITFSNNIIISEDCLVPSSPLLEPGVRFNQFETIVFTGNTIGNINATLFANFQTVDSESAIIADNTFVTYDPGMVSFLYPLERIKNLTLTGNDLDYVDLRSLNSIVSNNTIRNQLIIRSQNVTSIISNNTLGSAINNSEKTSGVIYANNYRIGGGDIFTTRLTVGSVSAGNSSGGNIFSGIVTSQRFFINVESGVVKDIFDLTNTDRIGFISVSDNSGTRIGSYGSFGNFNDGSTNSSFLTNVQNSGVAGSDLTLASNIIKFEHTFGSTRELAVSILFIN